MSRTLSLLLLSLLCAGLPALAADREAKDQTETQAIDACLASWGTTPFQGEERPRFKVLASSVKVFGIGGDVTDETVTTEPRLVLVKPAVSVFSKAVFRLMNPNGWYCFQSSVTVLAKTEIHIACKAHMASSIDGVTVAGGNEGADGVTVLGKAVVKRVGCNGERDGEVERGDE
jgi:hypothetical protein